MSRNAKDTPPKWTVGLVLIAGTPLAIALTFAAILLVALLLSQRVRESDWIDVLYPAAVVCVIYLGIIFVAALITRATRIRPRVPLAMVAMALCAAAALGFWLLFIGLHEDMTGDEEDLVITAAMVLTLFAAALLHNGIFSCMFIRSFALRVAVIALAASAWIIVLPLIVAILIAIIGEDEWLIAIVGPIVGFLSLFVIIASAIMPALIRRSNAQWEAARETVSERSEIAIECPQCGHAQRFRAGPRLCGACGLLMTIEIEEPRCECGYLLYRLQSPTCPECGRDVPTETNPPAAGLQSACAPASEFPLTPPTSPQTPSASSPPPQ